MKMSVVFAARNEEGNIAPLCRGIRLALAGMDYEVIGVDDGSSDGTLAEMESMAGERFRVIPIGRRAGKCYALHEGMRQARGDVIATIDADQQNDPHDIPRLLAEIGEGCDFACGWRKERADGSWRAVQSRIGNALNNVVLGVGLHDSNCPLKAFRRECVSGIRYFRHYHRFLPALAARQGFSVMEIPVSHRPRASGRSKYGFSDRVFGNAGAMMKVKFAWKGLLHEGKT